MVMEAKIRKMIVGYVQEYKAKYNTETQWRKPVIGFADVRNPMFKNLKQVVGVSHVLPEDLLASAKSVVVFFLPFEKDVVRSNREGIESSRAWDIANIESNNLILDINKYMYEKLSAMGYESTIMPATYNYDEKMLKSDWSHRHVGVIAGVGKFGIQNMLITEQGCCGRMGSIVTNIPLEPSKVSEIEACLYKYDGTCGKCIDHCVAKAMSFKENRVKLDRYVCNNQIYNDNIPEYDIGIGDACGKCMCGLPCSYLNPVEKIKRI